MILLVILLGIYCTVRRSHSQSPAINFSDQSSKRIALSGLLIFTGTAHFYLTDQLIHLLPPTIPCRPEVIYVSGMIELMLAAGVLWHTTAIVSGRMASLFFAAIFPFNVYAAMTHAPVAGHSLGPLYLVFRLPLQLFLIWWAKESVETKERKLQNQSFNQ